MSDWQTVGEWMWENKASYNGLSVLPFDNGNYKQAPFEDITKEVFESWKVACSELDLSRVFEPDDVQICRPRLPVPVAHVR